MTMIWCFMIEYKEWLEVDLIDTDLDRINVDIAWYEMDI